MFKQSYTNGISKMAKTPSPNQNPNPPAKFTTARNERVQQFLTSGVKNVKCLNSFLNHFLKRNFLHKFWLLICQPMSGGGETSQTGNSAAECNLEGFQNTSELHPAHHH